MERYAEYNYYKGEKECPFPDLGHSFWWKLEAYAYIAHDKKKKNVLSPTMVKYLKNLMWDGDCQHDTTEKEMLLRAHELYKKGKWARSYICLQNFSII